MEAYAISKFNRISPIKMKKVAKAINHLPYPQALSYLRMMTHKAADLIGKTIKSAGHNLVYMSRTKDGMTPISFDEVVIKSIIVNEGPTFKRIKSRARGRVDRIKKRTSHVTVIVEETSSITERNLEQKAAKAKKKAEKSVTKEEVKTQASVSTTSSAEEIKTTGDES